MAVLNLRHEAGCANPCVLPLSFAVNFKARGSLVLYPSLQKRRPEGLLSGGSPMPLILHRGSHCDICLEPYTYGSLRPPHAIPCGHIFCREYALHQITYTQTIHLHFEDAFSSSIRCYVPCVESLISLTGPKNSS